MFESDDWTLEDDFNDVNENAMQSRSQYQNEEDILSVKRRKIQHDRANASSCEKDNTNDSRLDSTRNKDDLLQGSKSDASRENLLLEIFQENTHQKTCNFAKEVKKDLSRDLHYSRSSKKDAPSISQHKGCENKKSGNKVALGRGVKLVRIFPGPAGLISPLKKNDNFVTSHVDNTKKLENDTVAECMETSFSKSQDEKNLFGEKAWRLLLNDLPDNFFKEHSISIIKSKANASHCNSMKIKFIAGILDYIDHSHEDPFVVLKDSTASVEGTIHRDIPLSYPGALEPNVVVLLHDVGLLKTTTNIVANKYHILVSRVNLLAIYSNKGRVVHTSSMKNILSDISNIELTRDRCIVPVSKHCIVSSNFKEQEVAYGDCDNAVSWASSSINTSIDDNSKRTLINDPLLHRSSSERENCKQTFNKKDGENLKLDNIFESFEHSMDMDDDIFFSTEIDFDFISDKQKRLNLTSSEIVQTAEVQRCELETQNINCQENPGRKSIANLENKLEKQNLHTSDTNILKTSIQSRYDKTRAVSSIYSRENSHASNDVTHKTYRDSNSDLKSASPITKSNTKNSRNLASYFTGGTLCNNEYDSDDEMLSQLDVDSF